MIVFLLLFGLSVVFCIILMFLFEQIRRYSNVSPIKLKFLRFPHPQRFFLTSFPLMVFPISPRVSPTVGETYLANPGSMTLPLRLVNVSFIISLYRLIGFRLFNHLINLTISSSFVDRASSFSRHIIEESDHNRNEEHRLHQFYYRVQSSTKYPIKNILLLSHGNAEVQRGFSMKKNLLQEIICGKSLLTAHRLVHQAIRKEKRKEREERSEKKEKSILNIKIDGKMLIAVKLASQQHLKDKAKEDD